MPLQLFWPTQFKIITQKFGANEDFYKKFGLPGHEGVDFQASSGSKIFACAAGTVVQINQGLVAPGVVHAYGIHIRIAHKADDGDYETIYGHLLRVRDGLKVGDRVKAGELIAQADNTGNSLGDHLHLSLKKTGATGRGENKVTLKDGTVMAFPRDFIDPAPFLLPFGTPAPTEDAPAGGTSPAGTNPAPVGVRTDEQPKVTTPPKLTSSLSFMSDITIPDESVLPAGGVFIKTWGIRNNGTSTWGDGFTLRHVDHTNMAMVGEVPLSAAAPGGATTVSVSMTAPLAPGRYRSTWRAFGPDGKPFGVVLFVIIRVVNA
ncbi:MAG: peptidoglycan DD-metalloendopeptidase family protein [Pleurocapsa minor GSE-CHR-MK-17-07R]|jgi:hypothetical protein|nr:peptidoglycan DD-metalloendopeptidase family protein [Pleurocapsa minor GSE-CHR-MK 17-07R]